jgi:hypothetical protein
MGENRYRKLIAERRAIKRKTRIGWRRTKGGSVSGQRIGGG